MTGTLSRVDWALARYAAGAFPMDDDPSAPEIPWYVASERAIFELDAASRSVLRRRLRRSIRACEGFVLQVDRAFPAVLALCAEPPGDSDGVWITDRLKALYLELHAAGYAHSFELWTAGGELAAGVLGVTVGRAVMLESMRRRVPHAGNALLSAVLDLVAERGGELCDIQLPTPHTLHLGCRLIDQDEYERRLAAAVR